MITRVIKQGYFWELSNSREAVKLPGQKSAFFYAVTASGTGIIMISVC